MAILQDLALALLNGFTWGVTLALVALGLALIFGLLEIVNVSHGALYMLGAVGGYFVIQATDSFLLALAVAPVGVAVLGVGIERAVLRPIEDDIPATVIATFGLLLVLEHLALIVFGPSTRAVSTPIPGVVEVWVTYPIYRLVIAGVALASMGGLYLFLHRSRFGLWMRAVRQDRETASAMGVPTSRVYMATFGLGAYFAAMAGVLLAPIVSVNHLMGFDILAVAFIVVMVGGLGSLRGVLVVSILFALIENVSNLAMNATPARVLTLLVMVGLVLVRPEGIFGHREAR